MRRPIRSARLTVGRDLSRLRTCRPISSTAPTSSPLADRPTADCEACRRRSVSAAPDWVCAPPLRAKVPAVASSSVAAEDTPPTMLQMACSNVSARSRTMLARRLPARPLLLLGLELLQSHESVAEGRVSRGIADLVAAPGSGNFLLRPPRGDAREPVGEPRDRARHRPAQQDRDAEQRQQDQQAGGEHGAADLAHHGEGAGLARSARAASAHRRSRLPGRSPPAAGRHGWSCG